MSAKYLVQVVVLTILSALCLACRNGELLRSGKLSHEDKRGIVEVHNKFRNRVASGDVQTQPPAENMREMKWDDELAVMAQKWADQCIFEHDTNRKNRKGKAVGQNLYLFRSTRKDKVNKPDLHHMIKEWFDEVFYYGYNGTFTFEAGHYSQMIWGSTHKIGCGYSAFYSKSLYNSYLVCNYYPAGNVDGEPPYTYGRRNCEDNDLFSSISYPNLCTIDAGIINACYSLSTELDEARRELANWKDYAANVTTSNNDSSSYEILGFP